jgi:hypothetical protein
MKGMIGEHFHSSIAAPYDPLLPLVTSLLILLAKSNFSDLA